MPSIFVSYKRKHEPSDEVVRALEKELQGDFQILRDQTMEAGKPWSKELYSWLLECDVGIAIVSEEANTADWCRREWSVLAARAQATGLLVIPIHLGGHIISTGILDDQQAVKWSEEVLSRIRRHLSDVKVRTPSSKDFLAAHQAWLRWQFREEPVLGQEPYSLRDVYIDTECGEQQWQDINVPVDKKRKDPFSEQVGGRRDLVEATLARMADKSLREAIVVQAGPGSGKSAFVLRIANELMSRGFTPIVVRFRDLRLATFASVDEVLEDAIRIGHTDDEAAPAPDGLIRGLFSEEHSLDGTKICRAVVILDGWDEVSLTGNVTYQAQLQQWLPRLREFFVLHPGRVPIRLLLTGRPSSEVGDSGVLQKTTPILTMRPIRAEQLRAYAAKVGEQLASSKAAKWSIDLQKLEPVFGAYDAWFSAYSRGAAPSGTYGDVLGNPLLAYLSLRVIGESAGDPAALLSEPTALYHELVEATVKHAGKGKDAGFDGAVHRGGAGLRRLLQEVASTITILRNESVSYSELQARFEDPDLPVDRSELANWTTTPDTRNALRELVVNFYFKGGNSNFGCEFLHKSFREYLFAEAVVEALREAGEPERPGVYAGLEYWEDFKEGTAAHRLSRRLGYLLAPQWLSPETEGHLRWLVRNAARSEPDVWQRIRGLVTEVYGWWAEGVHLRHQPRRSRSSGGRWLPPFIDQLFCQTVPLAPDSNEKPVRTTILDAHLGHSLMRIACALYVDVPADESSEAGRRKDYCSRKDGRLRFRPGRGSFMTSFMGRIRAEGWLRRDRLSAFVFGPVDLSGEILDSAVCMGSDLPNALLSRSSLVSANLTRADVSGADVSGADVSGASLMYANLTRANLTGANLMVATLAGANLTGADLSGSNLTGADLTGANLARANLTRASLTGANLQGASAHGADFTDARVERGSFREMNDWESVLGTPRFIDPPPPERKPAQ